ncbi:hypothetical protein OC834_006374 [Tilletia horrida]|nr:hypothetical protein OC834_006374 [Tilletia horrida]KAK0553442.1 hypothetical protein OC844_006298 [Tilletia horrida]
MAPSPLDFLGTSRLRLIARFHKLLHAPTTTGAANIRPPGVVIAVGATPDTFIGFDIFRGPLQAGCSSASSGTLPDSSHVQRLRARLHHLDDKGSIGDFDA